MSAMQRTKGQAGEREIASLVRDLTVQRAGDLLPVLFYRVDRADWRAG